MEWDNKEEGSRGENINGEKVEMIGREGREGDWGKLRL
jgi:hypothetical protein